MEIGIIGTGDMGKLYAREFARVGYRVNCSDLPEKRGQLEKELEGTGVRILDDGIAVSRISDLVFYLVEVENIARAVAQYGNSTKEHAIVSSGTSVMTPAVEAFEKDLPKDVSVINWHWLFGPSIKPQGQSTALVNHRSNKDAYQRARDTFEMVGSRITELPSYQEHDKITADTQVVTQLGFEAMGTAWKNMGSFPWENPTYAGGIDNVKVLMCMRIYAGRSHVYAGLAIHNPFAREQVRQYAQAETDLFSLMIQEKETVFREMVYKARDFLFKNQNSPILLDDRVMQEFSLGIIPPKERAPNSHLSYLPKPIAWSRLGINPYNNLVCQTPLFRLLLGGVEYLYTNPELLEESIRTALFVKDIRKDDLEFHTAVREWATIIGNGDTSGYHKQFADTRAFFGEKRLAEGKAKSDELIRRLSKISS